ncbi:MAG: trimeric intracellular cation channel family protein [Rhodospirillaceae bacterium]|nr:trimeric intracellular cation channel family protein [Rhodospirillaceae bacterium]
MFLVTLDLLGAFAFAISGASAGIDRKLDIFGILVLSFVAATFGGIARDLLIGAVPPAAIASVHYLAVSLFAGLATFIWYPTIRRLRNPVLLFDAIGLAFFVVVGTQKALAFGLDPAMAAILGMLTGIGGGVMRDLLVAQVPVILRTDFYAVAALAGGLVVAGGSVVGVRAEASALVGGAICLGLRLMALRYGWRLPTGRSGRDDHDSDGH